jgi:hypothetical protein
MQLVIGNIIRIFAGIILIGSLIILLVGGGYAVMEARTLDGPSQYDMLYLVGKICAVGFGIGVIVRLCAWWLIRNAPPLEAADLPIGRNDRLS